MSRPAIAIVDLNALRHNYQLAKNMAEGKAIVAVVKANAYGHGAIQCAQALIDRADAFAVACIEEALVLRAAGISQPIVLLEGFFEPSELSLIEQHRLDIVVHHKAQIQMLARHRFTSSVRVWLKMDTGMHRMGFLPGDYSTAWQTLHAMPQVKHIILMSHMACSDEYDSHQTLQQLAVFEEHASGLPGEKSIANSASLIAFPATRARWNRPGLMLYGISPFSYAHTIEQQLQPVMALHADIISIKDIPTGSAVGYGNTWIAKRPTRLAVIAIGYADGYPCPVKGGASVLINGQRAPLVGRVSMDMLTIDITNLPAVQLGDTAVLWGKQIAVAEVAYHAGTIPYQLLCNLNRVPVHYIGHATTNRVPESTAAVKT